MIWRIKSCLGRRLAFLVPERGVAIAPVPPHIRSDVVHFLEKGTNSWDRQHGQRKNQENLEMCIASEQSQSFSLAGGRWDQKEGVEHDDDDGNVDADVDSGGVLYHQVNGAKHHRAVEASDASFP